METQASTSSTQSVKTSPKNSVNPPKEAPKQSFEEVLCTKEKEEGDLSKNFSDKSALCKFLQEIDEEGLLLYTLVQAAEETGTMEEMCLMEEDMDAGEEELCCLDKAKTDTHKHLPKDIPLNPYVVASYQTVTMPMERTMMQSTTSSQVSSVDTMHRIDQVNELAAYAEGAMQVIEKEGIRETSISIGNQLPLFKGTTVVVTTYKQAPLEFNIQIENLTQAAKLLLDTHSVRSSLLNNFTEKGYVVHMFITTTKTEHPLYTAEAERRATSQGQGGPFQESEREKKERESSQENG